LTKAFFPAILSSKLSELSSTAPAEAVERREAAATAALRRNFMVLLVIVETGRSVYVQYSTVQYVEP
jgi:hypothetical protein